MVERGKLFDLCQVRKLKEGEVIKSFNCGDKELNDFLINKADKYKKSLLSVSYVLEKENCPIAYFSLSNDSLSHERFDKQSSFNRLNRNIDNDKRMRQYPAVKIGRFAVAEIYKQMGVGQYLLSLIKSSMIVDQKSGCRFITVDAYNDAIAFYQKNGFVMLNEFQKERRAQPMFFDLAQLT